jgi:hypothetical protein
MADRLFRAGARENKYRHNPNRITPARYAWVRSVLGTFVIMRHPDLSVVEGEEAEELDDDVKEYDPGDPGETIILTLPIKGRGRPLAWNLSSLTHAELVAIREYFDIAFELAEPVCIERDKAANEAFDSGDDSVTRIYRALPELIVRNGEVAEHGEGLRVGSQAVSARRVQYEPSLRGFLRSSGRLREDSGAVADPDSQPDEPEDDGATAD